MSKTIFITGGSSGLGRTAAKRFLSEGYTVVITGRTKTKLKEAVQWIQPSTDGQKRLHTITLDLESLSSIRDAVEAFKALGLPTLDILINNAGRMTPSLEYTAETDKVEKTIFTNAIGPWYLTMLLKPLIPPGGRIFFVTSDFHNPNPPPGSVFMAHLNTDLLIKPDLLDLLDGKKAKYNSLAYYKVSKLAVLWIAYVMAQQYPELSINAFCPGFLPSTGLSRDEPKLVGVFIKLFGSITGKGVSEEDGVSKIVYYVASEELKGVTGEYFKDGKKEESSERSHNMEEATKFWNLACDICKIPEFAL
ncbi:hypothetical protein BDB00DRAFT_831449 [Zychaea mexicana]|uniref:uncharacterized protein n=1 Tax=Zychaea mexicana TaxID=64656 RepID=UPI0022FE9A44|nr:uncharacterized protein BDB00DRAFT_831449 [Zychaea mexicana]KAI9491788.1 hypothetical protein BDB00DRAFT_831449 [Zychaea mexicana]